MYTAENWRTQNNGRLDAPQYWKSQETGEIDMIFPSDTLN